MSKDSLSPANDYLNSAKLGDAVGVTAALRAGANKEARDPEWHNGTALHCSAHNGHKNVVIKLFNVGVNADARDDGGRSALHHCCIKGHETVVLLLIGRGVLIDATDNKGRTPLMVACREGHDNLVELLLNARADAGLKDKDGNTSMHHASCSGYNAVVKTLAQYGAGIRVKNIDGCQPILMAASMGHDLVVAALIKLGAEVNCKDDKSNTPIWLASEKGHDTVVRLLLEAKAHVEDISPLYVASHGGYVDIVATLLSNGSDKNITSKGSQATHTAAQKGHLNVLGKLQGYNCDLNAVTEKAQNTALHLSVKNGNKKISKWLINNGANPYASNKRGHTSIQLALKKGHAELASFMTSKNLYSIASTSTGTINLECVVCMDHRTSTVMTLPCRHAKTCQNCMDVMEARGDNQCPICRVKITQRFPIYL